MIYVHDIIAISGLAVRVYTSYKDSDAPDHRHISEDIAALRVLIDKVASHSKSTSISNDYHHCGQKTLKACQSVLEDLNSFIEKYKRLASIDKRLVFNVVKLGKHDITVLHSQLISNTGLLNGFVRRCVINLPFVNPMDINIYMIVMNMLKPKHSWPLCLVFTARTRESQ